MYESFKEISGFLKFTTVHALACFLFLVVLMIPSITITYKGEPMTAAEIWKSGFVTQMVFISLSLPLAGVLLLRRSKYARQIFSALLLIVMVTPYIYWQEYVLVVFGVVVSVTIIGYLFINSGVRAYFGTLNKRLQRASR